MLRLRPYFIEDLLNFDSTEKASNQVGHQYWRAHSTGDTIILLYAKSHFCGTER